MENYKFDLRNVNESDYDFVYEVKKEAYKKYVEEYFGNWNEEQQIEYFKVFVEKYKAGAYIITLDGCNIGFYNSTINEDKMICLQYFKSNPVGRLYERLGFKLVGETAYHFQMMKDRVR